MKIFRFAIILVSLIFCGCVGPQPMQETYTTFEKIIEVPNYTKNEIFDQTKIFIAENFRSAKSDELVKSNLNRHPGKGRSL